MAKLRNYLTDSTQDNGMMPGADFPDQYPPQNGPIQDFPLPQGGPVPVGNAPAPAPTPAPAFDINQWYQQNFNRAPDANEIATDTENIAKYGEDAYKADFAKRRDNKPTALPGGGSMGDVNYFGEQQGGGQDYSKLMSQLEGLFPNGAFNQDIVNRRVDNVRDQLNRFSKSRSASNRAALANRGLIGSGPEITAMNRSEENIADTYSNALSGIYADESQNADNRMIQALQMATGMTSDQARLALERELGLGNLQLGWGRLGLDQMLGTGDLALKNLGLSNDYNLGLGRLGLDRDRLQHEIESGNIDQIIQILSQWLAGSNSSAGGYI